MTTASFDLANLNGRNGFVINGINADDFAGDSISGAGDINGDGIDDLIVGAYQADANGDSSGQSYVVFGSDGGFPASLELANLNGSNGFAINSINAGDFAGDSISGAGDINNDGIDDLIIGAPGADPNSNRNAGQSYVVFGSDGGFPASLELADLNGSNGFALNGINVDDFSGGFVSGAGDINSDGFDDLIIGADLADINGNSSGQSYVVFGSDGGFPTSLELADLNGINGFAINGIDEFDSAGRVSGAGDINSDGFDDLIIGAPFADPAGQSYVVFGSDGGFPASLELADLNGSNGFALNGINAGDSAGGSVSGAGDVNSDDIDDLIIGASADANGNSNAGQSYVVFGSDGGFPASLELADLNGSNGFALNGINANDFSGGSVSGAGDINSDDIDDLIIGASADANGNSNAGQSYVVFGSDGGFPASLELADLNGNNGFTLNGINVDDFARNVSGVGDINNDGIDDLIIGAFGADANGNSNAGQSYVVFGFNIIDGTLDDDLLIGTPDSERLYGFAGNDTIIGRAGDDTIDGGAGRDRLFGNDGFDSLLGSDGRDFLAGNRGDDLLDGGADNDLLFGGRDADQFVLREGDGRDTIFDYRDGTDSFLLDGLAFEDLTITQGFGQTVISVTDSSEELASLLGVDANDLGAEDFSTLV